LEVCKLAGFAGQGRRWIMRNLVKPFLFVSGVALAAVLAAAPALGQGMAKNAPSPGDMNAPASPGDMNAPARMDQMDNNTASALRGRDRDFVMDAARGGLAEVELGKLAVAKGTSPDVKQFGQRMIDDHSKANDKLREVALAKGVTLPSEMDRKTRDEYRKLDKMSGERFDHAYVDMMVKDHKKDVADFDHEAKRGNDPDVQRFASMTLPTLQEHLTMVEGLKSMQH
jgi:putative membrane protein